ncbi:MAG: hypothetical protein ACK4UN_16545 [Limisphaerales bacterium]
MSMAKQIIFARLPAAKEFVALALLNLFLFVQLVSVFEAFEAQPELKKAACTYYSQHQTVKATQTDKTPSLEKVTLIAVLSSKLFVLEAPVSERLDELETNFFLSDQFSSSSLKGRAPPLA